MVRRFVVPRQALKVVSALVASTMLMAAGCPVDLWDVGHPTGDRLHPDRPECPVMWDTIPLASSPQVDSILNSKDEPKALPTGIGVVGSGSRRHVVFTPKSVVNPVDGSMTQDGELPLSGPITNIPEFHDCQRFLSRDGASFDSLFAIFASFKMDETIGSLMWTTVAAWSAGPPAVVTVDPVTGVLTGIAPGTATVNAVDTQGNSAGSYTVTVTAPASPPGTVAPSLPVGPGAPPAVMHPGEQRQLVLQMGVPSGSIIAAATVYAYGPGYVPLGIGPNFNCLYLYFKADGKLRAKIVHVNTLDEYEHACLTAVDPNQAVGKELAVARSAANFGKDQTPAGSYPSVARWDADSTGKQYIGIRCLDAWCEIGEPTAGTFSPTPSYTVSSAASLGEKRVVQVKGWYDEQILAAPGAGGAANLRPSGLRGTVIPAPSLDAETRASLTGSAAANTTGGDPWKLVAYVAIRDLANDQAAVAYYRKKFGFEPAQMGPLETLNQMHYCYGTRQDCKVPSDEATCDNLWQTWFYEVKRVWVKIVAVTGSAKYLCITRRGHPTTVPATARWRWILGDDTIWTACVQGCCQTEAGA